MVLGPDQGRVRGKISTSSGAPGLHLCNFEDSVAEDIMEVL